MNECWYKIQLTEVPVSLQSHFLLPPGQTLQSLYLTSPTYIDPQVNFSILGELLGSSSMTAWQQSNRITNKQFNKQPTL